MLSTWTSLKYCCLVKSCIFITQSRVLRTLSEKHIKNIMAKGENAGNELILLFPQYFLPYKRQKLLF